ncbi:MAG: hypothetical protein KJN99_09615, partial [Marinicaulis sp.]|nr:hypothetical protein [Marinicaulis sp.]
RKMKLLTGLSTIAAGAMLLSACSGEGDGEGAEGESDVTVDAPVDAGAEGEGAEGEGEGGESEGVAERSGDPADDNVAYLHQLGMMRGHLEAFSELYRSGDREMGLMHAKHPESELYAALAPAFAARQKAGFADELTALVAAATAGGDIDEPYNDLINAMSAAEPDASPRETILAVSALVKSAAEEFELGVDDDGSITNLHEYQDAYGFVSASRVMLSQIDTNDINTTDAISHAHEQLDVALIAFPGLVAESTEGMPSTLYGAAARIEIAALGL